MVFKRKTIVLNEQDFKELEKIVKKAGLTYGEYIHRANDWFKRNHVKEIDSWVEKDETWVK